MPLVERDASAVRPVFRAITPYAFKFQPIKALTEVSTPQVDLRPSIGNLGLAIRSQGSRGTCSGFAVTFALEYLYRTRLGLTVDDLSEEYLISSSGTTGVRATATRVTATCPSSSSDSTPTISSPTGRSRSKPSPVHGWASLER